MQTRLDRQQYHEFVATYWFDAVHVCVHYCFTRPTWVKRESFSLFCTLDSTRVCSWLLAVCIYFTRSDWHCWGFTCLRCWRWYFIVALSHSLCLDVCVCSCQLERSYSLSHAGHSVCCCAYDSFTMTLVGIQEVRARTVCVWASLRQITFNIFHHLNKTQTWKSYSYQ